MRREGTPTIKPENKQIHEEAQEQLTQRINKLAVELPGLLKRLQSADLAEKTPGMLFLKGERMEKDISAIEEATEKLEEILRF